MHNGEEENQIFCIIIQGNDKFGQRVDALDITSVLGTLSEGKQRCPWMTKVPFKTQESCKLKPLD